MQKIKSKFVKTLRTLQVLACMTLLATFTTVTYSASKTVLVLGDSLSAEYGLPRGTGWVALLEQRLKAEKIEATIVNASISGETTSGGKGRIPGLLAKHHPAVVVIELGGNDGLRGLSIKASEENFRSMIAAAKKSHAMLLLLGMQIPPNYGRDYTEKFSTLYPKLAIEMKIALVPFVLKDVADKPQLFQADHIHPTTEAQSIMLDNVWPHIKPLLAK
jgi:acyl-CoA thioesterase-1